MPRKKKGAEPAWATLTIQAEVAGQHIELTVRDVQKRPLLSLVNALLSPPPETEE